MEFVDNRVKVKAEMNAAILAFLHEASAEIKSQAERNTPVDTSQLKRSWGRVVDKGKMQAIIGNPLEYAIWQEFGTGEYALEGNGRKGYWVYVKNGNVKSNNPKTYTLSEARRVVAGLRSEGLEAYYTKGTRPKRMLYKAFKTTKPRIQARAQQIFKSKGM